MATQRRSWGLPRQQRMSRRRILRGTAIGGAGLMAMAALSCGQREKPATVPVTKEPKPGGVLDRAGGTGGNTFDTQGIGLDPMINNSAIGARGLRLFYQGLLGYDFRTYEVEPELAQKWQQPSQTEYIFTLQPGVRWHNKPPVHGRALTVEDVVLSLERARRPDPLIQSSSYLVSVDKIEAIDNARIRITTKGPDASFLTKLSADSVLVLAPEMVERYGDKFPDTAEAGIGTGAFIVTSVEQGVGARYVRNPDYWKPGLPYLDEVRTRHFAEDKLAWAAFLAGQLDVVITPDDQIKNYIAQQGQGYTPDWFYPDLGRQALANVKRPPMNDPRVPRALRLLIDHEELIKTLAENVGRNGSMFVLALRQWDFTHEEYYTFLEWKQPKDEAVRVALDLLRAAGFTRENPLKFEIDTYDSERFLEVVQLIQAQWRRFSQGAIDVQIRPYQRAVIGQRQSRRQHTYLFTGLSGAIADVDATLSLVYRTGGARNFADYSDPKLDDMIDKQRTLFDTRERKVLVREILLYGLEHLPYTTPFNTLVLPALKPRIQGFAPEQHMNGRQYERIWLET